MNRHFELDPYGIDKKLIFSWDDATGEVSGPDAAEVLSLARHAQDAGYVISHPYPSRYDIAAPLHSMSEMSAVLGQFWRLSEELLAHHPEPPRSSPNDANDGSPTLEPIY